MAGRTEAIRVRRDAARLGDFRRYFFPQQNAAATRLGALADLDLDHLDLIERGLILESRRIELAVLGAAAEISRAQFPDQIAAAGTVIARHAALAGVVIKPAFGCAAIERFDCICAERAETHRRNVEHARRIRLRAIRSADIDAKAFW